MNEKTEIFEKINWKREMFHSCGTAIIKKSPGFRKRKRVYCPKCRIWLDWNKKLQKIRKFLNYEDGDNE